VRLSTFNGIILAYPKAASKNALGK